MLISVSHRFVFIANPKTASTSIERALQACSEISLRGSPQRKHAPWASVRKTCGFLFGQAKFAPETFFRFGVLREPADWVLSWYNYRLGRGDIPSTESFEALWQSNDWVKKRDQMGHFIDKDGECRFDVLIPIEHVAEAVPRIGKMLGVRIKALPRENASRVTLRRDEIPDALASRINAHFARDHAAWQGWSKNWLAALEQAEEKRSRKQRGGLRPTKPVLPQVTERENAYVASRKILLQPLDSDPDRSRYRCGGTVMLRDAPRPAKWKLFLTGLPDGDRELVWRQPSPFLREKHPDNPAARRARFKGVEITLGPKEIATIALRDPDGGMHPVFEISRGEPVSQHPVPIE